MGTSGVNDQGKAAEVLQAFTLGQNWPDPFNSHTNILYVLPSSVHMSLKVYDVLGQEVVTLVEGSQEAGSHRVRWDGLDKEGRPVASGTYLYRLQAEGIEESRRMTLLR